MFPLKTVWSFIRLIASWLNNFSNLPSFRLIWVFFFSDCILMLTNVPIRSSVTEAFIFIFDHNSWSVTWTRRTMNTKGLFGHKTLHVRCPGNCCVGFPCGILDLRTRRSPRNLTQPDVRSYQPLILT